MFPVGKTERYISYPLKKDQVIKNGSRIIFQKMEEAKTFDGTICRILIASPSNKGGIASPSNKNLTLNLL